MVGTDQGYRGYRSGSGYRSGTGYRSEPYICTYITIADQVYYISLDEIVSLPVHKLRIAI